MLEGYVFCKKIESIFISNEGSWNTQAKGTFESQFGALFRKLSELKLAHKICAELSTGFVLSLY